MAANSTSQFSLMDPPTLQMIEEMSRNAKVIQENVLAQILAQNAETEYLKAFNLNGATDRETFKSKIPTVTYEDIQPLISRISNGDSSPILCSQPISEFIVSTGTSSGEGKLFPSTKEETARRLQLCCLFNLVLNQHLKGLDKGKVLQFSFSKPETETVGGIVARSALTSIYKSSRFSSAYTSPSEAIHCVDIFQSMFTQMLCGLYERQHVVMVGAGFASGLLRAINFLQLNWQQLTRDIRAGSLNSNITDTSIRDCMIQIMRPDPDLADSIARECEKGVWEGIIARIWPNTKNFSAVITGSMAQYVSTLDYYSGGLPIVSMMYASSECFFGINLNPMCKPSQVSYTIMPNMAYFEFLEPTDPKKRLVDLVDVEIDKEYELVITTYAGLYRYQVGDIVRVTGFDNSLPRFEFIRRKNVILSIDTDKTKEPDLQEAVENASRLLMRELNTSVLEYTSYGDTNTIPGHYVIYWELMKMGWSTGSASDDEEVMGRCCLAMEEALDSEYRRCRVVDKSIGPLEIRVVKDGTFEELMEHAISRGASVGQYKVPRCVNYSKPMVELLESAVVSTHFSPSLPHWTSRLRN